MASATNYSEEKWLRHLFGNQALTMPVSHFTALHTADPGETGATAEVSGGSYARQSTTFDWNVGGARVENAGSLTFTNMPAGTVSHCSVWDAATGGNCLAKLALASPQTLSSGQALTIAAGDLRFTAD